MTEGEGLLKEAKELLWGWHLPPVIGVGMGGVEMDQLGKCSKAIEVSRPHLSLASYPVNLLAHIYGIHFGLCVVCAHIPNCSLGNEVGGRERCTHTITDFNSLPPSLLPPSFPHSFHSPSLHLLTPPFLLPPSFLSFRTSSAQTCYSPLTVSKMICRRKFGTPCHLLRKPLLHLTIDLSSVPPRHPQAPLTHKSPPFIFQCLKKIWSGCYCYGVRSARRLAGCWT